MRFGVALPTCAEGLVYPLPFGDHHDLMRLAVAAEELGFDSVLVNDHLTTQRYVRAQFSDPPRYYEPLITLAWVAARTARIRLMTGVVVLPVREPVLLAKQVATLDQMSGGRVVLGVGVGAYREEFEAVRPDLSAIPRAELMDEGLRAVRELLDAREASFEGRHLRFADVELFPKPAQDRLPIYSSGNADGTLRRAALHCDGWMPAGMPLDRLVEGLTTLRRYAADAGRDPDAIAIAPQLVIGVASTREEAARRFRSSQVHEHLVSLQQSTLRGTAIEDFLDSNLIGTPDEIISKLQALAAVGVTELAGLIVIGSTPQELHEQMAMIATEVMPALAS